MKSAPSLAGRPLDDQRANRPGRKPQQPPKDDIEVAATSIDTTWASVNLQSVGDNFSHYAIAKKMVQLQSNDIGPRCEL